MRGVRRTAALGVLLASVAAAAAQPAEPDLTGLWTRGPAVQSAFQPPPSGPGPVRNLTPPPPTAGGGFGGSWRGDHTNPILQPWAAQRVKQHADADAAGKPFLTPQQRCYPHGVPFVLQLNDTVQVLQTPNVVALLYAREMRTRLIYLNVAHPKDLEPSYYGNSVGHFEGDTLVVDTIGLNDKTWTDRMGTPHTTQLHVVERYRLLEDGKVLRVNFTVEDPGAFTMPWSATVSYRPEPDGYHEQVCAENNRDPITKQDHPIPMGTADF
jgi:hypothetical protein